MNLQQVEYFLAVADSRGIHAAAEVLGVAQPTLSQTIRSLERELGARLFHRIGRGMVLSSAGHVLVGPARRLLRDVAAAEGALAGAGAGARRGRLDIVAHPALSVDPVAPLVGAFRRRLPSVFVRIGNLRDEHRAAEHLREGHCEIVVCHLPGADHAGLETCELGTQQWWLVCPPGTPLPPDDPMPLSVLPDSPYVIVPRGGSQVRHIEDALLAAGRTIEASAVLQHREARLAFVLAGIGGTLLERSAAETAAARGAVVRAVDPPISRAYGLLYDPDALSPAGRAFVETAHASAAAG